MTDPDLNFIDGDINLEEVGPLDVRRVIACANNFITATLRFLNDFASEVQEKMTEMDNSLERIQANITLVEAQICSVESDMLNTSATKPSQTASTTTVPGNSEARTDTVPVRRIPEENGDSSNVGAKAAQPEMANPERTIHENNIGENNSKDEEMPAQQCVGEGTTSSLTDERRERGGQTPSSVMKVCEDPRYVKYFKMLRLGVVAPAVKQKMLSEGVDPSILDNPEAISNYHMAVVEENDEQAKSSASSEDAESDSLASVSDIE